MTQIPSFPVLPFPNFAVPIVPDEAVGSDDTGFLAMLDCLMPGDSTAGQAVADESARIPLPAPVQSLFAHAAQEPALPNARQSAALAAPFATTPTAEQPSLPKAAMRLDAPGGPAPTPKQAPAAEGNEAEVPSSEPGSLVAGVIAMVASSQTPPPSQADPLAAAAQADAGEPKGLGPGHGLEDVRPGFLLANVGAPLPATTPKATTAATLDGAALASAPMLSVPAAATPANATAAAPPTGAPPLRGNEPLADKNAKAIPLSVAEATPSNFAKVATPGSEPPQISAAATAPAPQQTLPETIFAALSGPVTAATPEAAPDVIGMSSPPPVETASPEHLSSPALAMASGERVARSLWQDPQDSPANPPDGDPPQPAVIAGVSPLPKQATAIAPAPGGPVDTSQTLPKDPASLPQWAESVPRAPQESRSSPPTVAASTVRATPTLAATSEAQVNLAQPTVLMSPTAAPIADLPHSATPMPATAPSVPVQITQALSSGAPVTELRLSPDELGHVRIDMRQDGDRLVMTVSVERQDTLDLLRRHAGELAADLRAAGHTGLDLSFGRWSGPGSDPGRNQPPTPQASVRDSADTPTAQPAALRATAQPFLPGSGLYLRI